MCVCLCGWVWMYVRACVWMYVRACVCARARVWMYVRACVWMYVRACVWMYVCACVCERAVFSACWSCIANANQSMRTGITLQALVINTSPCTYVLLEHKDLYCLPTLTYNGSMP